MYTRYSYVRTCQAREVAIARARGRRSSAAHQNHASARGDASARSDANAQGDASARSIDCEWRGRRGAMWQGVGMCAAGMGKCNRRGGLSAAGGKRREPVCLCVCLCVSVCVCTCYIYTSASIHL